MQGFPVGGSRIRLSWGRSQCEWRINIFSLLRTRLLTSFCYIDKAAQAAAQAAQAAALQAQYQAQFAHPATASVTHEQAMELLQKLSLQGFFEKNPTAAGLDNRNLDAIPVSPFAKGNRAPEEQTGTTTSQDGGSAPFSFDRYSPPAGLARNPGLTRLRQNRAQTLSSFSPFSPDPNLYSTDKSRKDSAPIVRPELLPHPSKSYAPGFAPSSQDMKVVGNSNGKVSPPSVRPPSTTRYGLYLDGSAPAFQMNKASSHSEAPVSRPSSGQTTTSGRGSRGYENTEHDFIQDLNGTLASLDLDQTNEAWRSPSGHSDVEVRQPFKMSTTTTSNGRTPSP